MQGNCLGEVLSSGSPLENCLGQGDAENPASVRQPIMDTSEGGVPVKGSLIAGLQALLRKSHTLQEPYKLRTAEQAGKPFPHPAFFS